MTTVFAFRIGPLTAGDAPISLYVPMGDDRTFDAVDATSDQDGLRQIAAMCAGCSRKLIGTA